MPDLFDAYDLSGLRLANRVVMGPMTRTRAPDDIADEMIALYYAQRATAGLIITEGAPLSHEAHGVLFAPGIYTPRQVLGWRKVTAAVHDRGGRIFAQLWHVGRVSHTSLQANGAPPVSSTNKAARNTFAYARDEQGKPGYVPASTPRALSTSEVGRLAEDFATAADNAIAAGFDGVELHAANGYLFDQFLNPAVNDRDDRYAARTMADRLRFTLETVDRVSDRIGAHRVGIRFSPYGVLSDVAPHPETAATYLELGRELARRRIAYVHLNDHSLFSLGGEAVIPESAEFRALLEEYRTAFDRGAIILCGSLTAERATKLLEDGVIDLAAFARPYIANPDLVARLKNGWPLAEGDRASFYGAGVHGYVDYPDYEPSAPADAEK